MFLHTKQWYVLISLIIITHSCLFFNITVTVEINATMISTLRSNLVIEGYCFIKNYDSDVLFSICLKTVNQTKSFICSNNKTGRSTWRVEFQIGDVCCNKQYSLSLYWISPNNTKCTMTSQEVTINSEDDKSVIESFVGNYLCNNIMAMICTRFLYISHVQALQSVP